MSEITINRTYKDRLFRLAFQEKQDLLDLYNAVSGRQYTDPAEKGCLECRATMININYGHNKELLEHCKRLKDYAIFIHRVRENGDKGLNLKDAVDLAVTTCIDEGILADILSKNRSEVYNLILYEYDEQKQLAIAREGAMKAGREEGLEQAKIAVIRKIMDKGMSTQAIAELLEFDENYVNRVVKLLKEEQGRSDSETARILLGLDE